MGTAAQERAAVAQGKGCLGKAADDEPIFILRAQDRFAPELVDEWASRVHAARGRETAKVREARELANMMRAWQGLNFKKTPD